MSAKKWYRAMAAVAVAGAVMGVSLLAAGPAQADADPLESVTAKHFSLRLAADAGQVANVKGAGTGNGVPVIQWPFSGAKNELWEATAVGGGYYRFAAVHSGKCLNVKGGGSGNDIPIIQYTCGNDANSEWKFVKEGLGYEIVARSSGKCLNVRGGIGKGHALIQYTCSGAKNDIWLPVWEPTR